MTTSDQRPILPPTPLEMVDVSDFATLVDTSLADTQRSAEAWRIGATALFGLVTASIFIKGPSDAAKLTTAERSLLTAVLGVGLAIALIGLWQILTAAAGTPKLRTLPQIVATYPSVKAAEVATASEAAKRLKVGRICIALSLILTLSGMVLWWWVAPTPNAEPHIIVTFDNVKICGKLKSADEQTVIVMIAGHKNSTEIPFANVDNLAIVGTCP